MDITTYLATRKRGAASSLAKKLGVSPAVVYQWRTGIRSVPVSKCLEIEKITNGLVTRRDLRKRDWNLIWPNETHADGKQVSPDFADDETTEEEETL